MGWRSSTIVLDVFRGFVGVGEGACGAWLEFFKSAGAEALQKGPDPSSADAEVCCCVFDAHAAVDDG